MPINQNTNLEEDLQRQQNLQEGQAAAGPAAAEQMAAFLQLFGQVPQQVVQVPQQMGPLVLAPGNLNYQTMLNMMYAQVQQQQQIQLAQQNQMVVPDSETMQALFSRQLQQSMGGPSAVLESLTNRRDRERENEVLRLEVTRNQERIRVLEERLETALQNQARGTGPQGPQPLVSLNVNSGSSAQASQDIAQEAKLEGAPVKPAAVTESPPAPAGPFGLPFQLPSLKTYFTLVAGTISLFLTAKFGRQQIDRRGQRRNRSWSIKAGPATIFAGKDEQK